MTGVGESNGGGSFEGFTVPALKVVAAPLSSIRTVPFSRWLMQSLVKRALEKGECTIFKILYTPTL